jgi:hypothetical protein
MPVRPGLDATGPFYRWGTTGKRYYYLRGEKAERQGAAIERKEGGRRVTVPPSLREALGDEISRSRIRTLAAWFKKRPETEHHRRGGAAVKRWVQRTAAALPAY